MAEEIKSKEEGWFLIEDSETGCGVMVPESWREPLCEPLVWNQPEKDPASKADLSEEEAGILFGPKLVWLIRNVYLKGSPDQSKFLTKPPEPRNLEKRLKNDLKREKMGTEEVAVLMGGYTDEITEKNIPWRYKTLLKNGFRKENIYILDNNPFTGLLCPVDDVATRKSFDLIGRYLSERVDDGDKLVYYFSGHGSTRDFLEEYAIPLWSDYGADHDFLLESEVESYFEMIHPGEGIIIFTNCFGGNFASRLGKRNYIAISASKENEVAVGSNFIYNFFRALHNKESTNGPKNKVSIGEAFNYALVHDYYTAHARQEPQIFYDKLNPMNLYLDK